MTIWPGTTEKVNYESLQVQKWLTYMGMVFTIFLIIQLFMFLSLKINREKYILSLKQLYCSKWLWTFVNPDCLPYEDLKSLLIFLFNIYVFQTGLS